MAVKCLMSSLASWPSSEKAI